jgi:hypothetical protein
MKNYNDSTRAMMTIHHLLKNIERVSWVWKSMKVEAKKAAFDKNIF